MTKGATSQSSGDDDRATSWWFWSVMRKSNKAQSTASGGRMQRIVSQAGLYAAAARLSLDSGPVGEDEATDENSGLLKYKLSGSLNAICISPDNDFVAAAGREVLKILTVNRAEIREVLNLRAGSHVNTNYSCNDVKWGNNITKGKIATAATNGAIILWDVNKLTGKRAERVINEHSRAVNRVCFQPENGHILLSASQDGTMKCWDLRDPKSGAKIKYEGKSESVRDVQFNPVAYHEFAAAFETGTIQKWDMRNPKAIYDRKVSAHNGPCLTLDWHPNGQVIASGGRDKTIKLWDMSVDSRRPLATIRTMAAVGRVQWRPGYEYEITSCALLNDNRINIWDIRRPHIAEYTFEHHEATPSGFLWLNPDVMYSCSKDKMFIRQEIKTAYEPVKVLKRNGMGWNIQGDLAFVIDYSSRDQFVDESTIPRPATSQTKKWKKLNKRLVEDEVTQYIPPQKCMIGHLPLFDFEAFSVFAEHYEISSDNVLASCQKNAEVAWNMGSYRTSQTWKMVALFFSDENIVDNVMDEEKDSQQQQQQQQLPKVSTDSATAKDNDHEDNDNESSRSTVSSHSSAKSSSSTSGSSIRDPERADLWPEWQYQDQIMSLLDYYTEQGDVQMCVTLYLVLSKHITVDDNRLEDWFAAYIDLLHRFKLWTTATAIINACPVARIKEMNENATTINIACNNCFKLVSGSSRGAWACDKCHKLLNSCSLCHQTVRGLYAWCQGCNHGGHLEHLRDWFSTQTLCPTGCGHSCTLTTTP